MKSIKQQYIDLQEGSMSQANFMRNLRMTMPQYITNVTSFEDSVRILKNKGILTEADTKTKWTNTSGKSMYDQFSEINNLNGQEVLIGIDYEIEKDHELTKEEATKIVIKNLKKNPIYYTSALMAGKEGYEPEYIGGKSAQPEARQMQPLDKNMGNVVDKKMGMQPVKDVEKAKKDSDKATAQKYKTSGISLMSLVAKTTRGVKKMDPTGEKMKKVAMNEVRFNDFGDPNKATSLAMSFIESNPTLKAISDKLNIQNSYDDAILQYEYWKELPGVALAKLKMQFDVERMDDFDEDTGTIVAYKLTPKHSVAKIDLGKYDLNKLTEDELMEIIREELAERFDGMEPVPMSLQKINENKTWNVKVILGREMDRQQFIPVIITDMGDKFQVVSGAQTLIFDKSKFNYPNIQPLEVRIPSKGFVQIPKDIADQLFNV